MLGAPFGGGAPMDQKSSNPDFLAAARETGNVLAPELLERATAMFNPDWRAENGISHEMFFMLITAALHAKATELMALAEGRQPDLHATFLGIKLYGMMGDCIISFDEGDLRVERRGERVH
jgi:hypothetical protein